MILRYYVACATCHKKYMLRIQLGIRKRQVHNFHCVECSEIMEVTVIEGSGIVPGTNCDPVDSEDDALPYYLSPDFVPSAEELHDPKSFPSFAFMEGIIRKIEQSGINLKEASLSLEDNRIDIHPELTWPDLQKAWRLHDARKFSLSNAILSTLEPRTNNKAWTLSDAKFDFLRKVVKFDEKLFEEVRRIKNDNTQEFQRFIAYYQSNLKPQHNADFYALITEFFQYFDDFSQAMLYLKFGTSPPEGAKATSVNFDAVKKFYATCYEFYAGAIILFTCMNNIKNGRSFDTLAYKKLVDYMKTDKAERRKSLENNETFSNATREFNNVIRNASFHNWFRLKDTKSEIEYRSGGTGQLRVMTYIDYLMACCNIFGQTCQLFMVELLLDESARNSSLVKR